MCKPPDWTVQTARYKMGGSNSAAEMRLSVTNQSISSQRVPRCRGANRHRHRG